MSLFDNQIVLGTGMIVLSVVLHVVGLLLLAMVLKRASSIMMHWYYLLRSLCLLVFSLLAIIALHMAEALGWAMLYVKLQAIEDITKALYFSVTTATTLGYGDITLSPEWQLLSTFEAIAGLLLFGASTAFLLAIMKNLFEEIESK